MNDNQHESQAGAWEGPAVMAGPLSSPSPAVVIEPEGIEGSVAMSSAAVPAQFLDFPSQRNDLPPQGVD